MPRRYLPICVVTGSAEPDCVPGPQNNRIHRQSFHFLALRNRAQTIMRRQTKGLVPAPWPNPPQSSGPSTLAAAQSSRHNVS